jgi:hypothetical protein
VLDGFELIGRVTAECAKTRGNHREAGQAVVPSIFARLYLSVVKTLCGCGKDSSTNQFADQNIRAGKTNQAAKI